MACPRAAGVVAAVWLSGALAQQVAFHPDALAAGAPGVQLDTQPGHLELRNPGFWKSEGWKEELGLWGWRWPVWGFWGGLCCSLTPGALFM